MYRGININTNTNIQIYKYNCAQYWPTLSDRGQHGFYQLADDVMRGGDRITLGPRLGWRGFCCGLVYPTCSSVMAVQSPVSGLWAH